MVKQNINYDGKKVLGIVNNIYNKWLRLIDGENCKIAQKERIKRNEWKFNVFFFINH